MTLPTNSHLFFLLFLGFVFRFPDPVSSVHEPDECLLNFDAFRKLMIQSCRKVSSLDNATGCQYVIHGISMIRSQYLQTSGYFSLPRNELEICWKFFLNLVNEYMPSLPIESFCSYNSSLLSDTCMNIENRSQFEGLISRDDLEHVRVSCNQPLKDDNRCTLCSDSLFSIHKMYFHDAKNGNSFICKAYLFMYAGAFANRFGPTDIGTAKCLFSVDFMGLNRGLETEGRCFWRWGRGVSLALLGRLGGFAVFCYGTREGRQAERKCRCKPRQLPFRAWK
ncbi:hypothetical protein TIFTF001_000834 [Ficus carica]|uniref:SPARK domain-containing protein n=1 Tax=Ficus carica TaxID=3494 RepID=A0AA87YWH3_FICCA|nr:hypothetical protein TIFTF001_000834 [Ficus carica]